MTWAWSTTTMDKPFQLERFLPLRTRPREDHDPGDEDPNAWSLRVSTVRPDKPFTLIGFPKFDGFW